MPSDLDLFLAERNLFLIKKISKGFAGDVFLVQNKRKQNFALKIERPKSRRRDMVSKEVLNLQKANSAGIGPSLIDFDLGKKIILMEFIQGKVFGKWVLQKNISKTALEKTIESLLFQARQMDEIGLDHGQLAGPGKNILVRPNHAVCIIDFEKASQNRRCHNVHQLQSFLFFNPHSDISNRVRKVLKIKSGEKSAFPVPQIRQD
ncbi:MAG: RIO1 family regulatory kinase/ATPase [Candidatus Micrarchaeota archaeon]